jgi:hypothetical protein
MRTPPPRPRAPAPRLPPGLWVALLALACGPAAPEGPRELPPPAPLPADAPARVAARHLLVSWSGLPSAPSGVRRSRAEALARATQLRARLDAGEPLADLAREASDDPTAAQGGDLGAVHRGLLVPHVESVLFALPEGGVAGPVESEFGFHLLRREPLVEVHLGEVLVQWAGLPKTRATRGRDEARAVAEALRQRLLAGEPLAQVARDASDGPTGPWGGDLGWFTRGSLRPGLDEAAAALGAGQISEVIESPGGFHVLVRLDGVAPGPGAP